MRGPRSRFLNFVCGLMAIMVLVVLDALDAGTSVQLCSKEFVCLHKSVEFVGQV